MKVCRLMLICLENNLISLKRVSRKLRMNVKHRMRKQTWNEEFTIGKQKSKEQDWSEGMSVKEKSISVRNKNTYLRSKSNLTSICVRNKRYLMNICMRSNKCFKHRKRWSWPLIKRGRHTNKKMSMQENKLSTKQTMIDLTMFRKWREKDPIWRISLMASKSRMLKLWETKKISRRKYCLPLISSRQSNSSATRPNSNLWSCSKLSKRAKRK